jgi:hypothetical protein
MKPSVKATSEFWRIFRLPRRPQDWSKVEAERAIQLMTDWLKTPEGTQVLRAKQAQGLVELLDYGHLICRLAPGAGKTLLSALSFTVLNAQRGLLVVPAHLRVQTYDEWEKLSKHWRLLPLLGQKAGTSFDPHVRVVSYQSLSTVRFASFLEEMKPDVVFLDEAHLLAHVKSARTKRVFRFLKESGAKCIPASGTFERRALTDSGHINQAAASDDSPTPIHYPDMQEWHFAIDENVHDGDRIDPGALLRLCSPEESQAGLDGIRRAVRRRIIETPGVVATTEAVCDVPLVMQAVELEVPESVRAAMADLRQYRMPNGESVESGISMWQHARELALGFYYRWRFPAPDNWRQARTAWHRVVRACIDPPDCDQAEEQYVAYGRDAKKLRLDSPLQVWNACADGRLGDVPEWEAWRDIKDSFKPEPVPVWIDDFVVRDAEEWALKTGGIVWLSHSSAFTEASDDDLGKVFTKIPYFGGGKQGEGIKHYRGPCAASISAWGTGANLQQWSQARIMCMPSNGSRVEQLLARHHRPGQMADEVNFSFYIHSFEMLDSFEKVRSQAQYAEAISGTPQRINSAPILAPDGHRLASERYAHYLESGCPMWTKGASRNDQE